MKLKEVAGRYGVARLPAGAESPGWMNGPGLSAMVRAEDELTIICPEARIPADVTAERGWACFRSLGPFAFDQSGVVAALVAPISAAGIGVFVLCTFDGEHILCPAEAFDRVRALLEAEGHSFES
ncbi:MAG: ACT domain-containing protein [Silicimonas sp.]|nr:ACT domain-containing protein [Silicimonas sp.]